MSTLYGSDAMGSVINIITRKVGREWSGSLQVENTINQDDDFGDTRAFNVYVTGPLIEDTLGLQVRDRLFDRQASNLEYWDADGELIEVSQRSPSPVEGRNYNLGARGYADTPEHAANATLRWQTTDKLSTWLSAEYRSERYRNRERSRGAPSFADLGDFKSYSLFHLGGSYAVTDNAKVSATIYNLLDKDFVDYRAYDDGASYGNVYANSEEGRRLWLSPSYEFWSLRLSRHTRHHRFNL
jgi:outer membrane receptor for ferrienterochelin and colicin